MPIINMVYKKKEKGWKPGANTIAYYPLTEDFNDHKGSGTAYNFSSSGTSPTIGTYGGVSCAYFSSSGCLYNSSWSGTAGGDYTVSGWFYKTAAIPQSDGIVFGIGYNHNIGQSYIHVLYDKTRPTSTEGVMGYSGGNSGRYNGPYSISGWTHLVVVGSNGSNAFYINGAYKGGFTGTNTETPNMLSISRYKVSPDTLDRSIRGYVSEVIFENKARTAKEISDYYNQIKSNYGL